MDRTKGYIIGLRAIAFPRESISTKIIKINLVRLIYLSMVSIFMRIITIISFINKEGSTDPNIIKWQNGILISHLVLLIIYSLINLASRNLRKRSGSTIMMNLLQYISIISIHLSGIIISLIDQLVTNSINPYIISSISIASIFLIKPLYSIILYLTGNIIFYLTMAYVIKDPSILLSVRTNSITITALGILLSLILWTSNVRNLDQKEIIERQRKELQGKNRRLKILSSQDSLTGLINRRTFEERTEDAIKHIKEKGQEASFILFDLNNFKSLNDKCGHPVGDELLRNFSNLLLAQFKESDLVARLGGDEFALVLLYRNLEEGRREVEDLIIKINRKVFNVYGHQLKLSTSVGMAEINKEINSFEEVYRSADKDLYKNKARNKL